MLVLEMMTSRPQTIAPGETLREAARLMDALNVGVLPVCDGGRLIGVITDRDIVIRSSAEGQHPEDATVETAMTIDPQVCTPDSPVEEAIELMQGLQVRRLLVVDADDRLVGIISLGDLATEAPLLAGEALEDISVPARPDR